MRRFCPSLTDLQAFEVAARHSSFTRAAQELCVTQGAVSKQVKHLEAFVGVELFLRIRQGLVLTEAGRAYLAKIQAGLGQIEAATVELIAHQGRGGTLNLTCMPTFGARWLIPRLTAFMRQRPDIHVEFLPHRQGYDFSTPSWTPPCASARPVARQRRRLHRGPGHRARVQPQVDTRRLRRRTCWPIRSCTTRPRWTAGATGSSRQAATPAAAWRPASTSTRCCRRPPPPVSAWR